MNNKHTSKDWEIINKKNSIGPALGMAMSKAIDLVIAISGGNLGEIETGVTEDAILEWRDWIYEENNKKHKELLAEFSGTTKEFVDTKQKNIF